MGGGQTWHAFFPSLFFSIIIFSMWWTRTFGTGTVAIYWEGFPWRNAGCNFGRRNSASYRERFLPKSYPEWKLFLPKPILVYPLLSPFCIQPASLDADRVHPEKSLKIGWMGDGSFENLPLMLEHFKKIRLRNLTSCKWLSRAWLSFSTSINLPSAFIRIPQARVEGRHVPTLDCTISLNYSLSVTSILNLLKGSECL